MAARSDLVPSVPWPQQLRRDLVLIALPPFAHRAVGLIVQPGYVRESCLGLVLQTGDDVTSVELHDRVIFDAFAAEEVRVNDWPCVLVPETAIDAVVE
jgi:hypothetical protein